MARGNLDRETPYVFESVMPSETYRKFKADKAWTSASFGERILTIALPSTGDDSRTIDVKDARMYWQMIRRTIAQSPALFDSMIKQNHVPK
jgi:hypothetical protein